MSRRHARIDSRSCLTKSSVVTPPINKLLQLEFIRPMGGGLYSFAFNYLRDITNYVDLFFFASPFNILSSLFVDDYDD